jgi:hypothetical protein
MELLFEILVELVLPLVTEIFAELALHGLTRMVRTSAVARIVLTALMYFGAGLVAGFFSLLIWPTAFARSSTLPGISLVITPLLGGILMSYIAWLRVRTWDWTIRLETFAYGFLFAFAMALLRLLFAQ